MSTPEERARELVEPLYGLLAMHGLGYGPIEDGIAAALKEAEAAMRERCAKLADIEYRDAEDTCDDVLTRLAAAIRNLK